MEKLNLKKIKADYELNGVTVIRNIIDKKWINIRFRTTKSNFAQFVHK